MLLLVAGEATVTETATDSLGSTRLAFAQIAAVGSLAFAQPVFSVLGSEEFVAAGWTRLEAVIVGALCVLFPTALLVAAEVVVGRIRPGLRDLSHAAVIGALGAAWVTSLVKQGIPRPVP